MKLTIGQKITLGYGLTMLFMAITGLAAYWGTERLLNANAGLRHTYLVIGDAETIRASLIEIESAARGHVVTSAAPSETHPAAVERKARAPAVNGRRDAPRTRPGSHSSVRGRPRTFPCREHARTPRARPRAGT